SLVDEKKISLLNKLKSSGIPLKEYVNGKIYRGVLTGLDKAFIIDKKTKDELILKNMNSAELIKPYLRGRDIKRYQVPNSDQFLIFIPKGWTNLNSGGKGDAWNWLKEKYTAIANHLSPYSDAAKKRYDKGEYWWELRACDYYAEFEKPKIMYLKFQVKPVFAFDESVIYPNSAIWIIPKNDLYLLGILNSKLGWFLISTFCTQIQNGYQLIFKYLGQIYIRTINFENPSDEAHHDKMVSLVSQILDLYEQQSQAKLPQQKTVLNRQIEATDRKIDELVYELYNLTEEEIKIVESGP
ncbi:MAG: restriction endonuclease subunit R, partial [Candidatus Roizmanbacteria bacterium]|nr:restriction endonuclease subunit R [Candidatus Roizmanbacteria bacterium]MCR4313043.1 restriction endonuclease subunit R [Candidatus Roizmanbacteria bacterium]